MGAFHEGHLALMRRAREHADLVVVWLFVNPSQFNEAADYTKYPRNEDRDVAISAEEGADIVFAPSVEEVYPPGFDTIVRVSAVGEPATEGRQVVWQGGGVNRGHARSVPAWERGHPGRPGERSGQSLS